MRILGIETSCDETSAAIVDDGRFVRSNVVSSQIPLHAPYGGVVPEIASRQHLRAITHVVGAALQEAGTSLDEIDAVAATRGPGLAGALLVGYNFAQALALARDIEFFPVNHLDGHVHSVWLCRSPQAPPEPAWPMLVLIVSGGHTQLVLAQSHGMYRIVGKTLDDAAGEAFDKVARLLGLGYPGGPAIQRVAPEAVQPATMPRAWLRGTFDFSFSGLKTATLHAVQKLTSSGGLHLKADHSRVDAEAAHDLTRQQVADLASGFQESVVDVLSEKTAAAAREFGAASVAVVGGVAANRRLSECMRERIGVSLFIASPEFSTDNAAMIASAGFYSRHMTEERDVVPNLSLATVR